MFFYCWYLIAIDHFHDDIDDENANDPTRDEHDKK
jgi:hypothetical protein